MVDNENIIGNGIVYGTNISRAWWTDKSFWILMLLFGLMNISNVGGEITKTIDELKRNALLRMGIYNQKSFLV